MNGAKTPATAARAKADAERRRGDTIDIDPVAKASFTPRHHRAGQGASRVGYT